MRRQYLFLAVLTTVLGTGVINSQFFLPPPLDHRILPNDRVDFTINYSNILPDDYVGPDSCKECHPNQHSLWHSHSHSKMNQIAGPQSVMGKFDDVVLTLPTGEARFSKQGSKYLMTVIKDGATLREYEVTRTVGSRYMQSYIGRQLTGPEPPGDEIYGEHFLPFGYSFKLKAWLPRHYFDNDGAEVLDHLGVPMHEALDRKPDTRSYTAHCMNCHNTFPYAYRIYDRTFVGFPAATVAATIDPLSKALSHAVQVQPKINDFEKLNSRLVPEKDLVTVGISCESCHFGGREHALQQKKIKFLPTSMFVSLREKNAERPLLGTRDNPETVNGICTQCHSGNGKLFPNGVAKANSREGLDMHQGFCISELKCIDCHEPHTPSSQLSGGPTNPKQLASCTKCHEQYAEPSVAMAHSRHSTESGVNCMDCHMPRWTQGVDTLVRTHRIGHPVEESMVAAGSANACNLCHLDKSLRWTLTELERGWGTRIEPKPDWPAYSKLDEPAGIKWLNGKDTQLRLVATECYARSPLGEQSLSAVAQSLNDPEPINRLFACFAVKKILGRQPHEPLAVNITHSPAERAKQIEAMLRNLKP